MEASGAADMKAELWFSEATFSFAMFVAGDTGDAEHRATLEPDARLLAVFEAASWEDAKHQKDEFLRGPSGFLSTYPSSS